MADSLFDILGKSTATSNVAAPTDSGQQFTKIAAAGTGKAVAQGTAPKASALGEQAALQGVQQKLDNITQQSQVVQAGQRQQVAATKQNQSIANAQLDQDALTKRTQTNLQTDSLLNQFEQGKESLDYNKNAAKIEQLGFNLRLSDDKYVFNLQQAGDKARLDNELSFKTQMYKEAFSAYTDLANDQASFQMIMNDDKNTFNMKMAGMKVEDALDLANDAAKQRKTAAQWSFFTGQSAISALPMASNFMGSLKAAPAKQPELGPTSASTPGATV